LSDLKLAKIETPIHSLNHFNLKKIDSYINESFIYKMVAFSKYFLVGDLIITPILQAVEALPTELIGYINEYMIPMKCERLKERYENIYGELQHIHSRNRPDLIEYAVANFTRFGYTETKKTYKSSDRRVYRKLTDMFRFANRIKDELDSQAYTFIRRIKRQYDILNGFYKKFSINDYAKVSLKLGTRYTSVDGKTYIAKNIIGKPNSDIFKINWQEDYRRY